VKPLQRLLDTHPPGSTDAEGAPYWTGTRVLPTPPAGIQDAADLMQATVKLRCTTLGCEVRVVDMDACTRGFAARDVAFHCDHNADVASACAAAQISKLLEKN